MSAQKKCKLAGMFCRGLTIALCLCACSAMAQDFINNEGKIFVEPVGGAYGILSGKGVSAPLFQVGGRVGGWLTNSLALSVEPSAWFVDEDKPFASSQQPVTGFGVPLALQWNFYQTERFAAYTGAGLGYSWFDHKMPVGSSDNHVFGQADLGANFRLNDTVGFRLGGRVMQVGEFSNKGVTALGGNLGVNFTF